MLMKLRCFILKVKLVESRVIMQEKNSLLSKWITQKYKCWNKKRDTYLSATLLTFNKADVKHIVADFGKLISENESSAKTLYNLIKSSKWADNNRSVNNFYSSIISRVIY